MFLICAVLIVVALIMLRTLFGIYATIEEKRAEESVILDKQLRNLKKEYGYLAGIGSMQPNPNASATQYLTNFSSFLRDDTDIKVLYLYVFVDGTSQRYSVTVGNYLKDTINATVNVTSSSTTGYAYGNINDRENATTQFSATANGTVTVNLTYLLRTDNMTETVPINVSTSNFTLILADITLGSGDAVVRAKEVYNRTWGTW